jgi:hypothetical protein
MATTTKMSRRAKWVIYTTAAIALPNFFIFWLLTVRQGGDSLQGYVKSGHYFVCAYGACTEVSKSAWTFSYWHAISSYLGILLIFIEAAIFVNTKDIEFDSKE